MLWRGEGKLLTMIVVVAPGQGSQKPGFLTPWLDVDDVAETLRAWSDLIDVDLVRHGTVSDQDTIRDTAIAQPLIVAAGMIAGAMLSKKLRKDQAVSYAGHSVGEFTAAHLAGVLSAEDAITLVALRGRAMAEAAAVVPTGMAAVMGGEPEEVSAELEARGLVPANVNGAGQIVAAGPKDVLAQLSENPIAGTRVIGLDVAGAFHTHYMASAVDSLREATRTVSFSDPADPLYTNSDGSIVCDGDTVRDLLVSQVSSPVRWDLCMAGFAGHGITRMIELPPAGALAGLAKRGMPGVEALKIDLPDHIDALTLG
jgi:[acyl-carrier-protein] S-malonyltransferase